MDALIDLVLDDVMPKVTSASDAVLNAARSMIALTTRSWPRPSRLMIVHTLPVDDLIEHVTDGGDCPCGPTTEPVERDELTFTVGAAFAAAALAAVLLLPPTLQPAESAAHAKRPAGARNPDGARA